MVAALLRNAAFRVAPVAEAEVMEVALVAERLAAEAYHLSAAGKVSMPMLKRTTTQALEGLDAAGFDQAFKPSLVEVPTSSWLGQIYTRVHPCVGRLSSADGSGGTAFVLKDGLAMTAYHSISRGTNKLPMQSTLAKFSPVRSNTMRMSEIQLPDGAKLPTELIAYNEVTDIAVLRILAGRKSAGLELAETLPAGNRRIAAIGYPRSSEFAQPVISPGATLRVAGRSPDDWHHIKFGARTWKGNSGGPLVDAHGDVVGLVSHGNPRAAHGVTISPRLDSMKELVALARSQKPGDAIIAIQEGQRLGQMRMRREPVYHWWNESNVVQRDFGKDVDPRIFM